MCLCLGILSEARCRFILMVWSRKTQPGLTNIVTWRLLYPAAGWRRFSARDGHYLVEHEMIDSFTQTSADHTNTFINCKKTRILQIALWASTRTQPALSRLTTTQTKHPDCMWTTVQSLSGSRLKSLFTSLLAAQTQRLQMQSEPRKKEKRNPDR